MEARLKRFLSLALALVMVIGMVSVNAVYAEEAGDSQGASTATTAPVDPDQESSKDDSENTHEHSYTKTVTNPTCTEGGYTTYTCECSHSYTAEEVNATGHQYVEGKCGCGAEDSDYVEPGENPEEEGPVEEEPEEEKPEEEEPEEEEPVEEEPEEEESEEDVDPVADVNGVKYTSLEEAIGAAQPNDTIKLLVDGEYNLCGLCDNVTICGNVDEYGNPVTIYGLKVNGTNLTIKDIFFLIEDSDARELNLNGQSQIVHCQFESLKPVEITVNGDLTVTECVIAAAEVVINGDDGACVTVNDIVANKESTVVINIAATVNRGEICGQITLNKDAAFDGTAFGPEAEIVAGTKGIRVNMNECALERDVEEIITEGDNTNSFFYVDDEQLVLVEIDGVMYTNFAKALNIANQRNKKIKMWSNVDGGDAVRISARSTLDLNGYYLSVNEFFNGVGKIVDTADQVGGIKIPAGEDLEIISIREDNDYLPIFDTTANCYRLYAYELEGTGHKEDTENHNVKFGFRLLFENVEAYHVLANTENSGLSIYINLQWTGLDEWIYYPLKEATIQGYAQKAYEQITSGKPLTRAMTVTLKGTHKLNAGSMISVDAEVRSITRVDMYGAYHEMTLSG